MTGMRCVKYQEDDGSIQRRTAEYQVASCAATQLAEEGTRGWVWEWGNVVVEGGLRY
jgi:hypothetical protein